MSRLAALLAREPVRAYLYGALLAGLALLVGYGVLTGEQFALWAALGAALLAVPAVEASRSRVTPVAAARGRHVSDDG